MCLPHGYTFSDFQSGQGYTFCSFGLGKRMLFGNSGQRQSNFGDDTVETEDFGDLVSKSSNLATSVQKMPTDGYFDLEFRPNTILKLWKAQTLPEIQPRIPSPPQ